MCLGGIIPAAAGGTVAGWRTAAGAGKIRRGDTTAVGGTGLTLAAGCVGLIALVERSLGSLAGTESFSIAENNIGKVRVTDQILSAFGAGLWILIRMDPRSFSLLDPHSIRGSGSRR